MREYDMLIDRGEGDVDMVWAVSLLRGRLIWYTCYTCALLGQAIE